MQDTLVNCLPHFIVDCLAKERIFRIRGDRKGRYGIYFTSIPPYGPLVLLLLEEFLLVL